MLTTPATPSATKRSGCRKLARISVVVADGQDFFLHQTRRILCQMGLSDIRATADGAEAMGLILGRRPHVAIIDWDMPSMNGLELTETLRQSENPGVAGVPLIMTLGSADRDRAMRARAAGIDAFLIKPLTAETLKKRMVATLTAAAAKAQRQCAPIAQQAGV